MLSFISLILFVLISGLLWPLLSRYGLGRLPGDVTFTIQGRTFYFPFSTSLLLSLIVSVLLGFIR